MGNYQLFDEGIDGLLNRLETLGSPNAQQFKDDFDNFVYEYGSRGPNEWESPHLETDPSIPLRTLDQVRKQPDEKNPQNGADNASKDRQQVVEEVRKKLAEVGDDELIGVLKRSRRCESNGFTERAKQVWCVSSMKAEWQSGN